MKLLVAYDGSMCAGAALEDMRRAGLPEQADALALCVADGELEPSRGIGLTDTDFKDSSRPRLAEGRAIAKAASDRLKSYFPDWTVSEEALWGPAAHVILKTSNWWHPDLLVAGSHGRSSAGRVFLGSVSTDLVHKAACSVRVVRRMPGIGAIRIVIGNDGSPEAEAVIRAVERRSWPDRTEAHIVSVIETLAPAPTLFTEKLFTHEPAFTILREADERARKRLREATDASVSRLRRAGLTASAGILEGHPGELILVEANRLGADAIFVGARGLGRMERFLLGSVSSYVLTHALCTVEVVRD